MRELLTEGLHPRVQGMTKFQHVAGGGHGYGQPDGRLTVHPERRRGGLSRFTPDGGNVGQGNVAPVHVQRDRPQAILRGQRPADPKSHIFPVRAKCARRHDVVLCLQGVAHLLQIQPHARQLTGREGHH